MYPSGYTRLRANIANMLVITYRSKIFFRTFLVFMFISFIITYYSCHNTSNKCYNRYSTAAHHYSRSHHSGGGCVNSLAPLLMANGSTIPIKYAQIGDLVFSFNPLSHYIGISIIKNITCHSDSIYKLWSIKDSNFKNLFTENHPIFINGTWMAIDVQSALYDFDVHASILYNATLYNTPIYEICSIELLNNITLAYNVAGLWFAD